MHPRDQELIDYFLSVLGQEDTADTITGHISECEQCRDRIEWLREWQDAAQVSADVGMPEDAQLAGQGILAKALHSRRTINLIPMVSESLAEPIYLAAAGEKQPSGHTGLKHRATLYSEQPELILRLMFDPKTEQESLHLISQDPEDAANVLIHLVEPSMDFVTNSAGIAQVTGEPFEHPETLEWQVRLPDATFMLAPLEGDPGEADSEQIVETDRGDRIGVTIKTEGNGINLRIRIDHVAGQHVHERVRLIVMQEPSSRQLVESKPPQPILIRGLNPEQPVHIRLFAD